ncbi:MAG: hypothetical protein H7Z37_05845, partial [Pyrinomonadaceae bacterium]|nr:hypothetical protein [Pyrinomonadaceae bacterium]
MKKLFANNRKSLLVSSFALLLSLAACLYFGFTETSAKDANAAIENALFVRQEFFGASAI